MLDKKPDKPLSEAELSHDEDDRPPALPERYRVLRELGRGGMGRVFAARDEKLGREVAIKVLASGLHGEEALRRFEQEARATCALNQANILDVHDIGTHQGSPYIVSELLHGITLRDRLRGGRLSVPEASGHARQLAQGLSAAHEKGIVHRDLKPENLFITEEDRLKILDFGIAKLVTPMTLGTGETLPSPRLHTEEGAILGTVGYMSPEQVRGQPADQRSDVFSFGAIFYEMLAGCSPFARDSAVETGYAILNDDPPPLPAGVPVALDRLVRRCLAKRQEDRFQSAHELFDALAAAGEQAPAQRRGAYRWALRAAAALTLAVLAVLGWRLRAPSQAPGTSIAVLPFINMSSDRENEYFSDGITEELINALANVEGLRVVSRTAVFALKGRNLDIDQIGAQLKVNTLLEGSVRREGNALRVTAQLINVSDGYHLWSQTYDRELKGVFALEGEIARSIAKALRHKLARDETAPVATVSTEAHDLYLRGRYFWAKRSTEALHKAADYFEQAIDKDPQYALAWAALADATAIRAEYDQVRVSEVMPKAKEAVLRALALDPGLAEAHGTLGIIHMYDYDWANAEVKLRKAIELKPDAATLYHRYALLFIFLGRMQEARAEVERALQLEPTSLVINGIVGSLHYYERDFDGAAAAFRKTLEMDPGFQVAHSQLGWALLQQGRYAEALAELDKGTPSYSQGWRGYALALAGRKDEARRLLAEMEASAYSSPAARALIWIGLGDKGRALALLQTACAERDWRLRYARTNPLYDGLRSDPRFHEVLRCAHLE